MTTPSTGSPDWSDPGVFGVADGVHRIPLPLPHDSLKAVNVYAIEDDGALVLIDSGWALAESRHRLEEGLNSLGYELGDVRRFLVTHVHRDHYTQAVVLRREFGMRVALGLGEQPALAAILDPGVDVIGLQFAQLRRCGADAVIDQVLRMETQRTRHDAWGLPDEWLRDAQRIDFASRTLDVIATPGHTQGHVVFVDRSHQLLFAGDHVLPHITPSIGLEPGTEADRPLADYLASLQLMRQLPDLRLLPAHGEVGGGVHDRVQELQQHHENRLAQSAAAVRAGARTAYETARALTWTRRQRPFDSLDALNQTMAVTETRAHLDVLVLRGVLTSAEPAGVVHYAPAN